MSRSIPIAQPLPAGFSIRKAIQCALLVDVANNLNDLPPEEIALVEGSTKA
mgnify:CR=1 FL=1